MKEIVKNISKKENEITTEVKLKNPADNTSTGTRIIQNKECITAKIF